MSDFYYRPVRHDDKPEQKAKKSTSSEVKTRLLNTSKSIGKLLKGKSPKNFKKPSNKNRDLKQILIWIGVGFVSLIGLGAIALTLLIAIVSVGLPNVKDLDKLAVAQSTTIYDREGNILYTKHGGENREYVSIKQISENLINATVALEDDRFWDHTGFDPTAIMRAVFGQLTGNSRGGGSTITQQYVKNAFLSPEKTYTRKLKELILAVQLEQEFEKEKILELYLNKIPYGNNAYGIEKAAQTYFEKSAKDVTLPEAVILASLPQAPTYYNPYGEHRYSQLTQEIEPDDLFGRTIRSETDLKDPEFLRGLIGRDAKIGNDEIYIKGRTDIVLKAMENVGYITKEERETALQELQSIEFKEYKEKINAPHFVFYILAELEEKYGKELVEQGGLKVYTTIDPSLQEYAEEAVEEYAASNTENYNTKNSALVSLDPTTGEILALVGSKDYFAEDIDGAVNIITQYRQPGSSFKPIVYAEAFHNRYAPASVVFDTRTAFSSSYIPNNYDGTFMGPISIRKALGQSRNIPAIKAYYLAGEEEPVIKRAEEMGIDFLDTDQTYGAPLGLGTAEVQPLDITSAFGVFASGGILHDPVAVIKVENSQGEVLDEWKESEGKEALDPQIAYLITNILSDKSVGLGENLVVSGKTTAAKTGTSTYPNGDPKDFWTIGYSPNLVTAAWSGNNTADDGRPTKSASGFTNAAPIWKKYMTNALADRPSEEFMRPEGIKEVEVSKRSGLLPGPNTPESDIVSEIFASFAVPTDIDNSGQEVEVDTRNNHLANKYCPEQFVASKLFVYLLDIGSYESWQKGADEWMESNMENEEGMAGNTIFAPVPTETSSLCTKARAKDRPKVSISNPDNNDHFKTGEHIKVYIDINARNSITEAEYFINGQMNYRTEDKPFTGTVRLPKGDPGTNNYTLSVKVYDVFGYAGEDEISIITSKNGPKSSADTSTDSSDSSTSSNTKPVSEEELAETVPTI